MLTLDIPSISDPPRDGGGELHQTGIFHKSLRCKIDQNRLSVQVRIVGTGLFREEGPEELEVGAQTSVLG